MIEEEVTHRYHKNWVSTAKIEKEETAKRTGYL